MFVSSKSRRDLGDEVIKYQISARCFILFIFLFLTERPKESGPTQGHTLHTLHKIATWHILQQRNLNLNSNLQFKLNSFHTFTKVEFELELDIHIL